MPINKEKYFNKIKEIIKNKNGKLLSFNEYKGMNTQYDVVCENNHFFKTGWNKLRDNNWCVECYKLTFKNITDAQKLAIYWGGNLLSEKFINTESLLTWECSNKHVFTRSFNSVERGSAWCKKCAPQSRSEEICRVVFEAIFNKKFPKHRADWLRNRHGKKLELDGFCEELNLAFEHNGEQHTTPLYYDKLKEYDKFQKTQENDLDKINICKQNNITIITISQLYKFTSFKELEMIVKNLALEKNIQIKNNYNYDFSNFSNINFCKKQLEIIQKVAKEKGGECLSKEYLNVYSKLQFKCKNKHIWFNSFNNMVRNNNWCKQCLLDKNVPNISKETLEKYYIIENKSIIKISQLLNTSTLIINKLFSKYNIERMSKASRAKNALNELYIVKNMTMNEIGKLYNVSGVTVHRWIKKAGIVSRPTGTYKKCL